MLPCTFDLGQRTWAYNEHHQVASETHPESGTVHSEYFDNGLLKKTTDANLLVQEYGYDRNLRLDGIGASAGPSTEFQYDVWDNRTWAKHGAVETTFDYVAGQWLTKRTDVVTGRTFVTEYPDYDEPGNIRRIHYPSGRKIYVEVDEASRPTLVNNDDSPLVVYASEMRYAPWGLERFTSGNGVENITTFDLPTQRPHEVQAGVAAQPLLLDLTYNHNYLGNVLTIVDGRGANLNQGFTYDALDRLTSVSGVSYGYQGFDYDERGNRFPLGAGYQYSGASRLTDTGAHHYTYDGNGSLETIGDPPPSDVIKARFTYTADRLVETAVVDGVAASYTYDADGLRTTKTTGGKTTYYLHGPGGQGPSEFEDACGAFAWARDYLYLGNRLIGSRRPIPTEIDPGHWKAEYFTNTTLTPPAVATIDEGPGFILHDWDIEAPTCSTPGNFSARWTRTVIADPGVPAYRITVRSGDQVRLKLDNAMVLEHWATPSDVSIYTVDVPLGDGAHTLVFEFANDHGRALADLSWVALPPGPDPFEFPDNVGVQPGVVVDSEILRITGLWTIAQVTTNSGTAGAFRVCADANCSDDPPFTTTPTTITHDQYVQLRVTSSSAFEGTVTATVVINGMSDAWTVRTLSDGCVGAPAPGTVCHGGSVFAGYSPDGNVKMYTTPTDAPTSRFASPETVDHGFSNWTTGKANTAGLAAIGGHDAAIACASLEAHGHDDWYLPAPYELSVLRVNGVAIGGFDLAPETRYWSSAEAGQSGANGAYFHRMDGYTGVETKGTPLKMRCVRRDMNSSEFSFTNQSGLTPNTTVTSNVVEMTGVGGSAAVSIHGDSVGSTSGPGAYRICPDAGCTGSPGFLNTPSTISDGEFLQLRLTSSNVFATDASMTIGVSSLVTTWTLTTATQDLTPSTISFPGQVVVDLSAPVDSAIVAVTSITGLVPVSVTGAGTYRICGDATCSGTPPPFGVAASTITNGQYVQLHATSSGAYGTSVTTTLTIGLVAATWTVTTFTPITDGQVVASCTPALNNGTPPPRPNAPVTCSASVTAGGVVLMSTGTGGGEPEAAMRADETTAMYEFDDEKPPSSDAQSTVALRTPVFPAGDDSERDGGRERERARAGFALVQDGPRGPSGGGHAGATQVERVNRPGGIAARVPAAFGVWGVVLACGALVALVRGAGAGAKARWRRRRARRRIAAWRVATLVALAVVLTALVPAEAEAQQSDVVEYYHLDALGSVRVVTNQAGQVAARHDFLPFGEEWPAATTTETKLFTGQERDPETKLDYFGARHYDPLVGRFTTVDPGHVNGNLDDPQSWNGYAYARNNPLRYTDPDGRTYQVCAIGGDCSCVSDAPWENAMENAGGGYLFRNGYMWALVDGNWAYAGSYEHISYDFPPISFDTMIHATGVLADRWLRENAKELAIGSAIAATGGLAGGLFSGGLAAEEVLGIGRVAAGVVRASSGQVAQMQRVLAQQGRAGVEKALRTIERRLAEHLSKIDAARGAGGYTSSMEREVRNFQQLIAAARQVLGR